MKKLIYRFSYSVNMEYFEELGKAISSRIKQSFLKSVPPGFVRKQV